MRYPLYMPTVLLLAVWLCGCGHNGGPAPQISAIKAHRPELIETVKGRAVSLRVLQERLQHASGAERDNLLSVCNLTRVDAVIADPVNSDIILAGPTNGPHPLRLADLSLALRYSFNRYAVRQGNVLTIHPLAVSIDPRPEVVAQLHEALRRRDATQRLGEFQRIAASLQPVHVYGASLPDADCAAIAQAVDCDYNLKLLSNGNAKIHPDGWVSLFDRTAAAMRADPFNARPVSSFDRFWLTAGDTRFLEDRFGKGQSVAVLQECPVCLKTEAEALNQGRIQDAGYQDSQALSFAAMVTKGYSELARADARYADLQAIFRWMAWGAILKMHDAEYGTERVLAYLLDRFAIPHASVPRALRGLSRVDLIRRDRPVPGGRQIVVACHTSSGGVNLSVQPVAAPDIAGRSRDLGLLVLAARPSPLTLTWELHLIR